MNNKKSCESTRFAGFFIYSFYSSLGLFSEYPHSSFIQRSLFPFSTIYEPHFGQAIEEGLFHDIKSHSGALLQP